MAESNILVPGIKNIRVSAPVPTAHIACMKPIDQYLDTLLAAAKNTQLLPLHRQAHYRDFLAVQKLNWAVLSRAEAEQMISKAEAQLAEAKTAYEKDRDDLIEAEKRASQPSGDPMTRDINTQTVTMARGLYIYQGSRIRYQEAKLAFARCVLANGAK
jgi:hypothetical protein